MGSTLNVSYATVKTVFSVLPSYYVTRGDGGYDIFSVGDEHFIRSTILGSDSTNKSDFETHYKSACTSVPSPDDARVLGDLFNKTPLITPRAPDGRPAVRMTTANRTKNFNLKTMSFVPGDSASAKSLDITFANTGDVTLICYTSSGTVTTDPTQAVKTVLDWEPTYNYEIIGGWIDIPPGIVGTTPGVWYVCAIGLPDIPSAYGGSVGFVAPTDLALVYTNKVVSDGRATQYLSYNATYHTNKMRWVFKHPTGTNPRIQLYVETFV